MKIQFARQEVVSLLTTLSQLCVLAMDSLATLDLRAFRQLEATLGGGLEDPNTYRAHCIFTGALEGELRKISMNSWFDFSYTC